MTVLNIHRRQLLQGAAVFSGGAALISMKAHAEVKEEIDWGSIRTQYPTQKPFLNLDNGCISPPTLEVQRQVISGYQFANENPCYNLFEVLDAAVPAIKVKLAKLVDCDPDEVSLNRCTTVGMCTAIFGMPLSKGDEVILCKWDYPSMISAWKQRAEREGLILKFASFELLDSDESIVAAYTKMITPRTRAIQLTHMIHWTGRVIPVAEICRIANQHSIRTVVDAAQSVAHVPVSFRDIGCDYLATSFHKWLSGPIGTGMLIVKAERIDETWPLFAQYEKLKGADKFGLSNLGTFDAHSHFAIGQAVDFHNSIGTVRKQKRLQTLTRYWVSQAADIPGFRMHTLMDHPNLAGLSSFSIDNIPVAVIEHRLRQEFKIQTRKRIPEGLQAIRVSPQLYTSMDDLNVFVRALRVIAKTS